MHILKLPVALDLFGPDDIIKAGTYYCEDVLAAQLLFYAHGGQMEPLIEQRKPLFGPEGDKGLMVIRENGGVGGCRSILFGRTGGLGDLTLLTPILREIKRRWPEVKLSVACIKELSQSIQNLPFIDEILSYPVSKETADTYDGWIWLEGVMEKGQDAKTMHSVDLVAKFIGLTLPADMDKRQAYVVTEKERAWAQWAWPKINGIRRLCIQPYASAKCRSYPQEKTGEVTAKMLEKGWEVFLLGAPGQIKLDEKLRPGLRIIADGATFRQRCALIETADCVLAPDSSMAHIAGALEVPCVALYGAFSWQQRTKYCPTTRPLTGSGFSCNPCNHHAHLDKKFPVNCPTKQTGWCGVLAAITPDHIVKTIEKIARGADSNVVSFTPEKTTDAKP